MKILQIFLLIYIITGSIFFIVSMTYVNETLLIISLCQLMSGSAGLYLLDNKGQKVPSHLKKKKD